MTATWSSLGTCISEGEEPLRRSAPGHPGPPVGDRRPRARRSRGADSTDRPRRTHSVFTARGSGRGLGFKPAQTSLWPTDRSCSASAPRPPASASTWARSAGGRTTATLPEVRTPGGHRRIPVEAVERLRRERTGAAEPTSTGEPAVAVAAVGDPAAQAWAEHAVVHARYGVRVQRRRAVEPGVRRRRPGRIAARPAASWSGCCCATSPARATRRRATPRSAGCPGATRST